MVAASGKVGEVVSQFEIDDRKARLEIDLDAPDVGPRAIDRGREVPNVLAGVTVVSLEWISVQAHINVAAGFLEISDRRSLVDAERCKVLPFLVIHGQVE